MAGSPPGGALGASSGSFGISVEGDAIVSVESWKG